MAVMVLPIFTSNADDIPDLDEMSRKLQNMQDNGEQFNKEDMQFTSEATRGAYDERMTGVFQDMFDFGYIWAGFLEIVERIWFEDQFYCKVYKSISGLVVEYIFSSKQVANGNSNVLFLHESFLFQR